MKAVREMTALERAKQEIFDESSKEKIEDLKDLLREKISAEKILKTIDYKIKVLEEEIGLDQEILNDVTK